MAASRRRFFPRRREPLARFAHLAVEGGLVRIARRRRRDRRRRRLRDRRGRARLLREVLIGVQELLAELVGRAAQLAHDAADVARHARQALRSEDQERDDEDEHQLLGTDAEHQRRSTTAARAEFAASRSARAADAAAASKSAPDDAYVTERDAEGSTPPPRASSAARIAVALSPPWLPTPGLRNRRSGASSRMRRASSGYVAPTTNPHASAANDATLRSTTCSYSGRPSTIRSWTSPAPGLLVRASTSA